VIRERAVLAVARLLLLPELPRSRPDAATAAAFDRLLEGAVRAGGLVDYRLDAPKHLFLAHAAERHGLLLHGSPDTTITEFEPRPQTRGSGEPTEAVFATPDPVWPLYFAILRRDVVRSLRNMPIHVCGRRFYYFSLSAPVAEATAGGTVYLLPSGTFSRGWRGLEWESRTAVRPLGRLPVEPADFPFLDRILQHTHDESTPRFALRLATDAFGRRRR
jgi:hypothetical protein